MKTVYLAISKSNRPNFDNEINYLRNQLEDLNMMLFVFVDQYNFSADQEKEMMALAFKEIDHADFIIAELSKKAIGVGVEVGYAFATNKPIIYIKREEAPYSTTVGGCANFTLSYNQADELYQVIDFIRKKI